MRAVLQRVSEARVEVDSTIVGNISHGFLLLLGIAPTDTIDTVRWIGEKIIKLRVFEDEEGKMNKSLIDVGGSILVVSQFTLYGDCQKGTRPGFSNAARPEVAKPVYEQVITFFQEQNIPVQTGIFGAHMNVSLVNDGPVTLLLEK